MNYTCPYCGTHTTITKPNRFENWQVIEITESKLGHVGFGFTCITCPNKECKQLVLKAGLTDCVWSAGSYVSGSVKKAWNLLPESEAKVLPDYVPSAISKDYYEACRIRDLSPKASATLSRRCLQGMIRDFHGIAKASLKSEIDELQAKIEPDVWESIEAIRSVGNIGAHMEKDINIIVDVEPGEAQLLIGLIEQLIEDWYVNREERRKRAKEIKDLAIMKKAAKTKSATSSAN